MASYRVQIWSADTADFSPDELVVEFNNPLNLGFGSYLNDIGECFWTISQWSDSVNIRSHEGKAHVVVIRNDGTNEDAVWRGVLAEHDANESDVIFYAYGYEHFLHSLHSQWKKKWKSVQIAGSSTRPIDEMWARAVGLARSPMQWMSTGTTESPFNTDAQTTNVVLNNYRVNWKPILRIFKELVALAVSDTENVCFFEIDYPADPTDLSATFNFWRDNSTNDHKLRLEYPTNVLDWSDRYVPVLARNQTLGVGQGPRNKLFRFKYGLFAGTFGQTNFGLHSQNAWLSWVRDREELKRIIRRRTKRGLRADTNLWVRSFPDSIPPWRSSYSDWELGDMVPVKVAHGDTQVDKEMLMIGEQVVFANGREYVQPLLEDRGDDSSTYSTPVWIGPTSTTAWTQGSGSASSTHSVDIPDDSRLVIAVIGNTTNNDESVTTAPTLNGVAATFAARQGNGVIVNEQNVDIWFWLSPPAGSTVDLVVTNNLSRDLMYGLISTGADVSSPNLADTDTANGAGGAVSMSVTSGTRSGFAFATAITTGAVYDSAPAGSTFLLSTQESNGDFLNVSYTNAATTGAKTIGLNSNARHAAVGVAYYNDDG